MLLGAIDPGSGKAAKMTGQGQVGRAVMADLLGCGPRRNNRKLWAENSFHHENRPVFRCARPCLIA